MKTGAAYCAVWCGVLGSLAAVACGSTSVGGSDGAADAGETSTAGSAQTNGGDYGKSGDAGDSAGGASTGALGGATDSAAGDSSAGSAGTAGASGEGAGGSGGDGGATGTVKDGWSCVQQGTACLCEAAPPGAPANTCTLPLADCCVAFLSGTNHQCQCVQTTAVTYCAMYREAGGQRVSACPP